MNKKVLLYLFFLSPLLYIPSRLVAQNLPVKEWSSPGHDRPFIFYITGDGGMNSFSTNLCESLHKKGYDITALNAKSYFWDKKTPGKTASDINNYISKKLAGRKNHQLILIGYSFGADVLPFVINRLSNDIQADILVSFLMASSGSTDFEIHWTDIFGGNSRRSMDVVQEINRLGDENMVIISGSDDRNLAVNKITLKKFTHEVLPGGHHFDGDTEEIVKVILNHIK